LLRGLAIAGLFAGAAHAEAPRSAIDWLSESILQPPNFVITPPAPDSPRLNENISSAPLDMVSRDAVGLLQPELTGFPIALWHGLSSETIIALIRDIGSSELPEIAALNKQVLLAQSDPPDSIGVKGSLLMARIDLLFSMGALEEAEVLILLAGVNEPEIFRRWFEITLIGQRTRAPCTMLKEQPTLSNDVATRAICLARAGDWNAAAITVSLAESLGDLSRDDADLLVRFLDPEMFEDLPDTGISEPLDPITFSLRESLALPRPDDPLPLPYLNADMNLRTPARQRIVAAERLVRASAISPTLLFAAYRGARAASSGGAWGRAEAVQELDSALVSGDDLKLAEAFTLAMSAFSEAGLTHAFAQEYADSLAHYPPGPDTGQIAPQIRKLLLLANRPISVWAGLGPDDPENIKFATQLASRNAIAGASPFSSPIQDSIHAAFANLTPPRADIEDLLEKIDSGQFGEVLLRSISLLANGRAADPRDLHEGLYLLLKLGLDENARRAAIQLLLLEPVPL